MQSGWDLGKGYEGSEEQMMWWIEMLLREEDDDEEVGRISDFSSFNNESAICDRTSH